MAKSDAGSDDSDAEDESDSEGEFDDEDDGDEEEMEMGVEGVGMSETEEKLVASFMNAAPMQRRSLADIIMEKIREKEEGEARLAGEGGDEDEDAMPRLPPKVRDFATPLVKNTY